MKAKSFAWIPFLFLFLVIIGTWLIIDFGSERKRIIDNTARLAIQKSQIISRSFGDTFLAGDYVLRDLLGRVNLESDIVYPDADTNRTKRIKKLLQEKVSTVPGLADLTFFTGDCVLAIASTHPVSGKKSNQRLCSDTNLVSGESLHIQYVPITTLSL